MRHTKSVASREMVPCSAASSRFSISSRASALPCAAVTAASMGASSPRSVPQSCLFKASKASFNILRFLTQELCSLQLPRLAAGPVAQAIGLFIAREFLPGRVPFQRPLERVGDVAQVTDCRAVDRQLDIAERLFARLDTVNEVAVDPPFSLITGDWLGRQRIVRRPFDRQILGLRAVVVQKHPVRKTVAQ